MANSLSGGAIFQWRIQNLSYCWFKKGEALEIFMILHENDQVMFELVLYPRGNVTEDHVEIYVRRRTDCQGPEIIKVDFQFAFLDQNGSIQNVKHVPKSAFARGDVSGVNDFLTQDKIFGAEKDKIFPQDILIIECRAWIKDDIKVIPTKNLKLQTTFEICHQSLFWTIDGFRSVEPLTNNTWLILSNESIQSLMTFQLVLGSKNEINLETEFIHESLKSFSFEIFVIDTEGKKVSFGSHKFFSSGIKKKRTQLISAEQLMQNASRYLPNDVLSLVCEYAYSTGTFLHTYEETKFGIISPRVTKEIIKTENESDQGTKSLTDDLKSMYSDAILCDIELHTSTQTFPAHKNILSARSPVFRKMFSTDMREKNCGHVDIVDLEDDTVQRMLLYMYTDSLGEFEFESVSKLYSAADKYAIISLKNKCSSALMKIISPSKACKLLVLADQHQDDELKSAAQNYILGHHKEVFASLEWKDFMATSIHLAAEVMFQFTQIKD